MIIVEGPDGAGKTRLCKYLSETCNIPLNEASYLSKKERNDPEFRSGPAVRERVYSAVYAMVTGVDAPEIHDRLFFSDLIYRDVLGGEPALVYMEQRHVCRLMQACEIPVIFCMPPFKMIAKNLLKTDQWDQAAENQRKIYNNYVMMAKQMSRRKIKGVTNRDQPYDYAYPKVWIYNYTRPDHLAKVTGVVKDYLLRRRARSGGWYEGVAPKVPGYDYMTKEQVENRHAQLS